MVTVASTASVANLCISLLTPDVFCIVPLKSPTNRRRRMSVVEGYNGTSKKSEKFGHTTGMAFPDHSVQEHTLSNDDKSQKLARSSFDSARGSRLPLQLPSLISVTLSSSPESSHRWSQNTLAAVFGAVARVTDEDKASSQETVSSEPMFPVMETDFRASEMASPTDVQPPVSSSDGGQRQLVDKRNFHNISRSPSEVDAQSATFSNNFSAKSEPAILVSKEVLRLPDQDLTESVDSHDSTSTVIREHVNESLSDLTTIITPTKAPSTAKRSNIQRRLSMSASTPSLGSVSEQNSSYTVRQHAIKELLDTEKTYLDDMRLIVKLFFERIANLAYLTSSQKKLLVRNAPQIHEFHEKFYTSLKVCAEEDKTFGLHRSTNISRCFIEAADDFGLYMDYCAQHDQAAELINDLKRRQEWCWFLEDVAQNLQRARPQSRMTITDYLIFPVQRICRYPLLLAEILKYTPVDSEASDRAELVSALKLAKKSASSVNKEKARLEMVARSQKFLSRLEEESRLPKEFVQTLGLVLAAGPLEVVILNADPSTTTVPRPKFCGVFLFANYMIIVRTKRKTAYEPKSWFPLHRWELQPDVPDEDAYLRHAWRLCHLERQYAIEFGATSVNEKDMWVDLLQKTLATSPPTSPDTEQFTSLPWTPNSLVNSASSSPNYSPRSPSVPDSAVGVLISEKDTSLKRSTSGKERILTRRSSGGRRTGTHRRSNSTKAFLGSSNANQRSAVESKLTDICTPNVQSSRAAARASSGASLDTANFFPGGPNRGDGTNVGRRNKSGHSAVGTSVKSSSWNCNEPGPMATQSPVAEGEQRLRAQTTITRRPSLSQPNLHSPSTSIFSEVLGRISTIGKRRSPAPKTETSDIEAPHPSKNLHRKVKTDDLKLHRGRTELPSASLVTTSAPTLSGSMVRYNQSAPALSNLSNEVSADATLALSSMKKEIIAGTAASKYLTPSHDEMQEGIEFVAAAATPSRSSRKSFFGRHGKAGG